MNSEYFSEALENISEPLIDSAARAYERAAEKQRRRRAIVRVASIAAVLALLLTWLLSPGNVKTDEDGNIISAPGILRAYACELDDMNAVQLAEYALIEGETSYKGAWSPRINLICEGIRLSFLVEDEMLEGHKITYDISVNYGEIEFGYKQEDVTLGKNGTIDNGETICWTGYEVIRLHTMHDTTEEIKAKTGGVYLDVILKADGNVIGYAVFEIVCTLPELDLYHAVLQHSVFYPKVEGEFQTISAEYVAQQIASAKSN